MCLPLSQVEGESQTQGLGYSQPLFREAPADVLGEGQQLSEGLSPVLQLHQSWAGFLGFSVHPV